MKTLYRNPVIILIAAVILYFVTHLILSRLSERIIVAAGYPGGFYYLPVSPDYMAHHPTSQTLNRWLIVAFYPCWKADKIMLKGPDHAYPPMLGLK